MRIIGGELRRRKLLTPKDDSGPRPIPDRVRESLFNLLRGHTEGAVVLDLFAGVGSFGLEAISRGAERVLFVERDRRTARLLQQNIDQLGVQDRAEVLQTDALGPGPVMRCPQDVALIMMDPPYAMARDAGEWGRIVTQASRLVPKLAPDGFLLIRTPWPHLLDPAPAPSQGAERKRHGREQRKARREVISIELEDGDLEGKDLDALFEALDKNDQPEPAPRDKPLPAGHAIPGAEGPETHDYGTTAVHLYARARSAAPADGL